MKTVTLQVLGIAAMLLLVSTGAWAAAGTGAYDVGGAGVLTFKTSPNVYVDYIDDGTATPASYVAGSVHQAGDRAYGIDPDYTGMYVKTVAVGTMDPGIPTAATGGSTGDFDSSWTPK